MSINLIIYYANAIGFPVPRPPGQVPPFHLTFFQFPPNTCPSRCVTLSKDPLYILPFLNIVFLNFPSSTLDLALPSHTPSNAPFIHVITSL